MEKLTLDKLLDAIQEQKREINRLQGIIEIPKSRGFIIWECCYNQYKQNLHYIEYLKNNK